MKFQAAKQDFAPGKKAMIIPPSPHDIGIIVELMARIEPDERVEVAGYMWSNPAKRGDGKTSWVVKSADSSNLVRYVGYDGTTARNLPYANLFQNMLMLIEPDNDQISDFVNEEVELTSYGY